MKKIVSILILISLTTFAVSCTKEYSTETESSIKTLYVSQDENAINTIKSYFKYMTLKDEIGVNSTLSEQFKIKDNFRFDNLISKKYKSHEFIDNKTLYESYIKESLKKPDIININDLQIFKVNYEVLYKDDSKEPIDSSLTSNTFYLVRDKNT